MNETKPEYTTYDVVENNKEGEKPYVLIGIPTMGSMSTALVAKLLKTAKDNKVDVGFYFTFKVSPVDRARNEIVKYFMSEKKDPATGKELRQFTHLFFIDSDTIPSTNALTRLLSHDKDIISGLTPILHYSKEKNEWGTMDNCFSKQEKDETGKVVKTYAVERNTGLQKIMRCGTSCLLIKREVFEKLEKPYFVYESTEDGVDAKRSEDIYFCDKASEAGIDIWCDSSVICNHYKDIVL